MQPAIHPTAAVLCAGRLCEYRSEREGGHTELCCNLNQRLLKFLQAGLPDGTHIAKIQDGVALLQCGNDWEVKLSLSPAQKPDMPDTSANASAAPPDLASEEDQATLDSQQKPEGGEAQVTLILVAGSC